jgi:hypothetical protein
MTDREKQHASIGARIYDAALSDRRGFRPDQIGIPGTDPVWTEIFIDLGKYAIDAVAPAIRAAALEEAAKVADDMGREEQTNTRDVDALMQACAREEMGYEIAAAIRALKEPTHD